jgi:hypothetical protein
MYEVEVKLCHIVEMASNIVSSIHTQWGAKNKVSCILLTLIVPTTAQT